VSKAGRFLVCVDLDDTTLDLKPAVLQFNNEIFGVTVTPEQYVENWRKTPWGKRFKSREEYGKFIDNEWWPKAVAANLYEGMRAMPGARLALRRLQGRGVLFAGLTSRPEQTRDATKASLIREFPDVKFQDIVFLGDLGYGATKGSVVRQMGGAMLVDDMLYHVESALKSGVLGLLFGGASDIKADEERGLGCGRDWLEAELTILRMLGI